MTEYEQEAELLSIMVPFPQSSFLDQNCSLNEAEVPVQAICTGVNFYTILLVRNGSS